MKKLLAAFLFLTFIPCLSFAQAPKEPARPKGAMDYRVPGSPIPPFGIETQGGGVFTHLQLQQNKPVWLMIFSPQCEHCGQTMDSLRNISGKLRNNQFVLVAEARNKEFMKGFMDHMRLNNDPLFRVIGTDKANLIYELYNYQVLPQLLIYNSRHKLVKTFYGNFIMDSVHAYLGEHPVSKIPAGAGSR
jgi:thiol-disulfide isomerase/thioredoxin